MTEHTAPPCPCERHTYWRNYMSEWRKNDPKRQRREKDASIRKRYGITMAQRAEIFEASDGLCAICYERPATDIDHDHVTGVVRGALCNPCNQGMGGLRDSIDTLRSAIAYLEDMDACYSPLAETRCL